MAGRTAKKVSELTERLTYRLHVNDRQLLIKLLSDMGMNIQDFGAACSDAFLRGDPHIIKAINDWKMLNSIPKEHLAKYTLSHRERDELLRQLENEEKEGK